MNQSSVFISAAALVAVSSTSFAQSSLDFGKNEYMASCASCHGTSAKGDGATVSARCPTTWRASM